MEDHSLTHSFFVAQGPLGHSRSALTQLRLGLSETESREFVLSSAWLWRQDVDLRARFSIGFPDEWTDLQNHRKDLLNFSFDFWLMQNLDPAKLQDLIELMRVNPNHRLIIAANHLMDWKSLLAHDQIKKWAAEKRAFLSFLPPSHDLDPFLKPQEVIWEMENLENSFPVLIPQFSTARNDFYSTLKKDDHPLAASKSEPFYFFFFRILEFLGFRNLIYALESLISYFLEGSSGRLREFSNRFFSAPSWVPQVVGSTKRAWAFSMNIFWYKGIFRALMAVTQFLEQYLWYRILFRAYKDTTLFIEKHFWYNGVFRLYNSFKLFVVQRVWYRGVFKFYNSAKLYFTHRLWHGLIKKYIWYNGLFWLYKNTILFVEKYLWYQGLFRLLILISSGLRNLWGIGIKKYLFYGFLFQIWIFLRYKSVPALKLCLYPLRKLYWIFQHEYDKRIRKRI